MQNNKQTLNVQRIIQFASTFTNGQQAANEMRTYFNLPTVEEKVEYPNWQQTAQNEKDHKAFIKAGEISRANAFLS